MAAMAPSPEDACIRRPRSRTRRTASPRLEHASGDHGAVLAHGVAGEVAGRARTPRPGPTGWLQCALGGDRRRQQGRLGIDGQVQLLGRALPGQLRDGLAEGLVRLAATRPRPRRGGGQRLAHADRLRALSRVDVGRHQSMLPVCCDGTPRRSHAAARTRTLLRATPNRSRRIGAHYPQIVCNHAHDG